ncbi:MAG: amidohydrolase [Hyphococcus sp.]|nr:MAG: amidohydrolase [Marinicaulis sp.]
MPDVSKPFKAACVQMRSGLDRARNTADAVASIEKAAGEGAMFIATPEMTNVVDRKGGRLLSALPTEDALEEINTFSEAAKRLGVWLLIGSVAVKQGERAANRGLLFAPDGVVVSRYDKLHMFDVDLPGGESWNESKIYEPGREAFVVNTPFAKLGLSICYDLRFPKLYREMAQAGANVLCVPAAFTRQTGEAHWKTLLRARAIENGAFVVAPAQGGTHEDGRETYGHSLIIGPWGEILAEADHDEPGIIVADIDPAASSEARQRIPNLALEQNLKISIINQ